MERMAGARIIGRYALGEPLAKGGMATVHLARLMGSLGFSRTVAIKRLHREYAADPHFVTMLLDEARLVARIHHPNVVQTLDVVATDGELFLVLEFVLGLSLAELARAVSERGERIPPPVASAIACGTLYGLHAAHEAVDELGQSLQIVHRDVSPQNILLGADGIARLLDFGVAKAAGRIQTSRDDQLKGKLSYVAPEQLTAQNASRRTDIYSAAVVLWETLTGERLFRGETEAVTLARVLTGEVSPPSDRVSGLPREVDEIVMKALARDPDARFETAREMAMALERALPMAPSPEVADWMKANVGDVLAERVRRVATIERLWAAELAPAARAALQTDETPAAPMTTTPLGLERPPVGVGEASLLDWPTPSPGVAFDAVRDGPTPLRARTIPPVVPTAKAEPIPRRRLPLNARLLIFGLGVTVSGVGLYVVSRQGARANVAAPPQASVERTPNAASPASAAEMQAPAMTAAAPSSSSASSQQASLAPRADSGHAPKPASRPAPSHSSTPWDRLPPVRQ